MGAGIVLALLFIYIIFRCLPPSVEEVDKCGVSVSQETYYAVEADGKNVAYFADYADSSFVGGSVNKDSISTRSVRPTRLLGQSLAPHTVLSGSYSYPMGLSTINDSQLEGRRRAATPASDGGKDGRRVRRTTDQTQRDGLLSACS